MLAPSRARKTRDSPAEVCRQDGALAHREDAGLWPRVGCRRRHIPDSKDIVRATIAAQVFVNADEPLLVCSAAGLSLNWSGIQCRNAATYWQLHVRLEQIRHKLDVETINCCR